MSSASTEVTTIFGPASSTRSRQSGHARATIKRRRSAPPASCSRQGHRVGAHGGCLAAHDSIGDAPARARQAMAATWTQIVQHERDPTNPASATRRSVTMERSGPSTSRSARISRWTREGIRFWRDRALFRGSLVVVGETGNPSHVHRWPIGRRRHAHHVGKPPVEIE